MTPRNLFIVILRILGIFFLRDLLAAIPQIITTILSMIGPGSLTEDLWILLSSFLVLGVYALISYYLIFKPGLIIDKLQLDKGFDQETIPLDIHRSSILSIATIVIGGLILTDEIPNLFRQLFSYYEEKKMTFGLKSPNTSYIILAISKVLIGYLLVAEQRKIVNFIERKRRRVDNT